MAEYVPITNLGPEENGDTKECLRKEVFYLKEALRTMRDYCRDLEQQLYDIQTAERKAELAKIPRPNLREASELSKTDFFSGKALPDEFIGEPERL